MSFGEPKESVPEELVASGEKMATDVLEERRSVFLKQQDEYAARKVLYDQRVATASAQGTFNSESEIVARREIQSEIQRLGLAREETLRQSPAEVVQELFKGEWRKFFLDELTSGRQTYDALKRGGGVPRTDIYELANKVFDRDSGGFDGDARMKISDQALEEAQQIFLEQNRSERGVETGERQRNAAEPEQKEMVDATKEKPRKEFSPKPEVDAFLRDQYLAYGDAPVTEEEKQRMREWTENSPRAAKYAESLRHLAELRNFLEIEGIAKEMVRSVKEILTKLGVPVSPYGESRSWALWDIAKQEYFAEHPDENDPEYTLGNIFDVPGKRDEIFDRHVGWELFAAYQKGTRSFVEKILKPEDRDELEKLLHTQPKENGTLRSRDLARLGATMRRSLG